MDYRQHENPKLCSKFEENDKSVNISIRRINIKGLVPRKSVRWRYIKIINKTSNFCNDGRYRNCKVHCQNFLHKQKVYREIGLFFSTGSWEFALWYYRAWVNVRHNLLDKIPTLGKHRICMRVYRVYGLRQHLLIY